MQTPLFGYARVSSTGQSIVSQWDMLEAAGCEPIVEEKASGASLQGRPVLERLLTSMPEGAVLVVTRLDRLARSLSDFLTIVRRCQERGVSLKSLTEPWADLTTAQGRMISQVFICLAEFERSLTMQRQMEGISSAKKRGVLLGRKSKLNHVQELEIGKRLEGGESIRDLARSYGVSPKSIQRAKKKINNDSVS